MWHRGERSDGGPSRNGDELAAYRMGRYADYLIQRGAEVPLWAWLNGVAEGSEVLVASLALAEGSPRGAPVELRGWYLARKTIAEEVLATLSVEGGTLAQLQEAVLVGLQLELAAAGEQTEVGPDELACLTLDALHAYRDPSRR
jgi:hypothetical protein